jgi:hypothetical protein
MAFCYYEWAKEERQKWDKELNRVLSLYNYIIKPVTSLGDCILNSKCATLQSGGFGGLVEDWLSPHFNGYEKSNLPAVQSPYDFCKINDGSYPVFINLKTKKYGAKHSGIAAGNLVILLYKGMYNNNPSVYRTMCQEDKNPKLFMVSEISYFIDDKLQQAEITDDIKTYFVESVIYSQVIETGFIKSDGREWSKKKSCTGRLALSNLKNQEEIFPSDYSTIHDIIMNLDKYSKRRNA